MHLNRFAGRRLARLVCMLLCSFVLTQMALADPPQGSSCDPNYMNALTARAYLEAQREVAQNQNLILKPDSVLEYTCFNEYFGAFSDSSLFSNSSSDSSSSGDDSDSGDSFGGGGGGGLDFGGGSGSGDSALEGAIDNLITDTLDDYLKYNFSNYLGGRGTAYPSDSLSSHSYGCDEMAKVWQEARCMNFFDNVTSGSSDDSGDSDASTTSSATFTDGFFDFNWYVGNDPRGKITGAYSSYGDACPTPVTQNDLDVAFNSPDAAGNDATKLYTLPNPPQNADAVYPTGSSTAPYNQDPVVTHLDQILPRGPGSAGGNCAKPIPTGVCVVRTGINYTYADGVCPNPGCHYVMPTHGNTTCQSDPNANVMGICQDANGQNSSGLMP